MPVEWAWSFANCILSESSLCSRNNAGNPQPSISSLATEISENVTSGQTFANNHTVTGRVIENSTLTPCWTYRNLRRSSTKQASPKAMQSTLPLLSSAFTGSASSKRVCRTLLSFQATAFDQHNLTDPIVVFLIILVGSLAIGESKFLPPN